MPIRVRPTLIAILAATLLVTAAFPASAARTAGPNRVLAREPWPAKGEPCRPRWPYVVLTCHA